MRRIAIGALLANAAMSSVLAAIALGNPRGDRARALVEAVVETCGTMQDLRAQRDVQYVYTYRKPDGKEDVSVERYIFAGELSWGKYRKREANLMPERKGTVIQGYDGEQTWMAIDGKPVTDPKLLKLADFLRKTNFYWFAMMQKLLDPGTQHTYRGKQTVGDIDYERVELTFDDGVGDVQDKYLLYINPTTKLVDQFLFTVMDFDVTKPLLMRVSYKDVAGIKLPVKRRYAPSNWQAQVDDKAGWTDESITLISFNNGFSRALFSR